MRLALGAEGTELMMTRHDRGGLSSPLRGAGRTVYSGVAARTHEGADPLQYASGDEYRDKGELSSIAAQLPGKPVRVQHGSSGYGSTAIGEVLSAYVDDDTVVVSFEVEPDTGALLRANPELSLGYSIEKLDDARYQRGIKVFEMSIVPRARCGPVCATRLDLIAPIVREPDRPDAELLASRALRADLSSRWLGKVDASTDDDDEDCDPDDCDPDDDDHCECQEDDAEDLASSRLRKRLGDAWKGRADLDDVDTSIPGDGPNFHVIAVSRNEGDQMSTLYNVSSHKSAAEAETARLGHSARTGHTAYVVSGKRSPVENDATTSASYLENES